MAENTLTPQDDNTFVTLDDVRNSGALLRDPEENSTAEFNPLEASRQQGITTAVDPSLGDIAQAAALGTGQGLAESAPLAVGAVVGIQGGIAAMPFLGPFAPFGPPVGLLLGIGSGFFASQVLSDLFPETQDKRLVSTREGFRTFSGGMAFSPVALAFKPAGIGANALQRTIGAMGDFARNSPKLYYSSQGISNFYAGIAGGGMAEAYPDSPGARVIVETAAGFAPSRLSPQLIDSVKTAIQKTKGSFSPNQEATQDVVMQKILGLAKEAGEDPTAFAKSIDEFLISQLGDTSVPSPTVAQLTGSTVLTKLQGLVARGNAKYSGDTKEIGEKTLKAYDQIIESLAKTGDPRNLETAAILRKDTLSRQFQTAFNIAQTNALDKVTKLGARGSDANLYAADILQQEFFSLLKVARSSESQLWQNAIKSAFKEVDGVLRPIKIKQNNFAEALYEITASPFSGSKGDIAAELNSVGKDLSALGFTAKQIKSFDNIPITPEYLETRKLDPETLASLNIKDASAIDMVRLRSSLLDKAREAGATGKTATAGRYSKLAEAVLDDLDALPEGQYAEARAFSRELNNAFTRTFAGEVTRSTSTGALKLAPEILVQRAFKGGADTTLKRMKDLVGAAAFADPSGAGVASVREAERNVMRAVAAEALNLDGTVNISALDAFRKKNEDALKFLGMTEELSDVSSTQRLLLEVADPGSKLQQRINSETAFKNLLEVDDPATAVSMALTDTKTPTRQFKQLVEIASSPTNPAQRKQALDGLLSTVNQYIYQNSLKEGSFSPQAFSDAYFKPLSPNNPSIANLLRSNGLMSSGELGRLKQMTNRMVNVEKALTTQAGILDPDKVFNATDGVEALAIAMVGAKVAGAIGPKGPGSLSFASKTIRAFENFFSNTPARQQLLVFEEITKDPVLFKQVMTRNPTPQQARETQSFILRTLFSPDVFISAMDRYIDPLPDEQEEQPTPRAADMLRRLPPAVATRGTPNMQLPTAQGPAEQAQARQQPGVAPQAPTGQSRQMLQQLFPFDTTLQAAPQG